VSFADRIELWFCVPEEIDDPRLIARYHQLLDEEEREKQQRFHFARHRHQYLVTRALVRGVLSRYAAVPPERWRFVRNAHGRPEPIGSPLPLRFNLSHTDGLAVIAVGLGDDLGVDVERARVDRSQLEIADRFFSAAEVAELRALPALRQGDRFFDYWTLKESYIKARGMGLALPLDQFSFQLGSPIRISFSPELKDDPAAWQFWLGQATAEHRFALAVRSARHLQLSAHKLVPFASEEPFPIEGVTR
jgi:4'-phosphopantetheinyl transferase